MILVKGQIKKFSSDIDFGARLLEKKHDQQSLSSPSQILEFLVTFAGLGRLPKAPGTWGTLGAIPVVFFLVQVLDPVYYLLVSFLICLVSIFIVDKYERSTKNHDSSHIVLDEVAGFIVAMAWLPLSWQSFLFAFLLFRFLDILKPFPIGYVDRKIKGGLGVMADDILAGIITNIVMQWLLVTTTLLNS